MEYMNSIIAFAGSRVKKCSVCGEYKEFDKFYKDKRGEYGLYGKCKVCHNNISRKYREVNLEKERIRHKTYKNNNKEKIKKSAQIYYKFNFEKVKERLKKWRQANPEKRKVQDKRVYLKERKTIRGRLNHSIKAGIYGSLCSGKNGRHWESLVDFTTEQLKRHLEKLFKPGMTWENYGTHWHIDHKIPIAVFNFEKPEDVDFRLCWSIKNLQPLEAQINIKKQDKINAAFQPSLLLRA